MMPKQKQVMPEPLMKSQASLATEVVYGPRQSGMAKIQIKR